MALVIADRVKETTTTTGTGTLTLAGAATGFQSFAAVGDGNTCYYAISSVNGSEWEVGLGTYTASGTTLARTTVYDSSNGGSAVNLSAGAKDVYVVYPANKAAFSDDIPTASEILTAIKTVDGTGSGLDADTVDGIQASSFFRSDADDTTTGTISINNINKSLRVGDITGDNYTEIKHTNSDGYGFDFQHNNASVVLNQQGTTNEVVVLGDVDSNSSTTLFGIGHSTNGGSSWSKKLNFTGQGDLYIGSSGTTKVATESYVDTQISGLGATTFPFYKEDGSSDTIAITNGSFPFYKADGSQDNIGVS